MNTSGFITIKEPCHEGWEKMSISEKGKFCSSCKKEVYDFSNSSIDAIKLAYLESKDGLCGHIPVRVLQEQYLDKEVQKAHFAFLKKFYLATLLCFGASLFTVDDAKASTFYKVKLSFFNLIGETKDTIVVKGIVKDKETRQRIPFAHITVLHNGAIISSSITNINGEYEVKIPKEFSIVEFKATNLGYDTRLIKNITISINKTSIVDIDMQLGKEIMLEGDIDIHYLEPK